MKTLQKGFTLVEISIVLVVISLLVGGVMGAQKMVEAAQITSVIADVRKFSDAVDTFEERYGALPGDLSDISGLPVVTPAPVAGNGNGSVDKGQEALQFWYQLMAAELVPGSFDGVSTFVPVSQGKAGGVPASKIPQSGYSVASDNILGLVLIFARFSSTSSTLPVFSPIDAYGIDKKMDDGNPDTGNIRAYDGDGVAANSCRTKDAYTFTTEIPACIMYFIIAPKVGVITAKSSINCNGSPVGTGRASSTTTCPYGYTGTVTESCMIENGAGVWRNIQQRCSIVSCGEGSTVGDTRDIACPVGYNGTITETCLQSGIWGNITANCGSASTDGDCTDGQYRYFSCPIGQIGFVTQQCTDGAWGEVANSCAEKKCSGGTKIGEIDGATDCPYTYYSNKGLVLYACTLGGDLQPIANSCAPVYGNGCSAGATREVPCASGSLGSHWQKCNSSGVWETDDSPGKGNNCLPANCGGYPVGYARPTPYSACPAGKVGTVMEMCGSDGKWKVTTDNCSQLQCKSTSDDPTRTNWNTANSGTVNVNASSCQAGYGTTYRAARDCKTDGTWSSIRGGCTRNCPSGVAGNATWAETESGILAEVTATDDAESYCNDGYVLPASAVTRQCTGGSQSWGTLTGACVVGVKINDVDFW